MSNITKLLRTRLRSSGIFFRGHFNYWGKKVYFPARSHIFKRASLDGIYEPDTTTLVFSLVRPGTTFFDVGANIGLLSVAVLATQSAVDVISIEASPDTLPYLNRTRAASGRENWKIIGAAVGDRAGEAEFWAADVALSAFNGLRDTGRGGPKRVTRVSVRTLDDIWRECGSPVVSLIKMDIEGGESHALRGAGGLLSESKPALIIEWSAKNLKAYEIAPDSLIQLAADLGYTPYAFPGLVRADTKLLLAISMAQTETFILLPNPRPERPSGPGRN